MRTSCRRQSRRSCLFPLPVEQTESSPLQIPGFGLSVSSQRQVLLFQRNFHPKGRAPGPGLLHKLSTLESKQQPLDNWWLRIFQDSPGVVSMVFPFLCNCGQSQGRAGIRPRGSGMSRSRNPWKGHGSSFGGFSLRIRFCQGGSSILHFSGNGGAEEELEKLELSHLSLGGSGLWG